MKKLFFLAFTFVVGCTTHNTVASEINLSVPQIAPVVNIDPARELIYHCYYDSELKVRSGEILRRMNGAYFWTGSEEINPNSESVKIKNSISVPNLVEIHVKDESGQVEPQRYCELMI